MPLSCSEKRIAKFFQDYSTINIPRYQRGYAWKETDIENFCNDIRSCYVARKNGKDLHHFFGGVVSITNSEKSRQKKTDIVDGQQRLTTFVILAANIIYCIDDYIEEYRESISQTQSERLQNISNVFRENFVTYKDKIDYSDEEKIKLVPTTVDYLFFESLLLRKEEIPPVANIASRRKLKKAFSIINDFLKKDIFLNDDGFEEIYENLTHLNDVLEIDCSIISISTEKADNAYRYFQVLNARGQKLSTGDLLKARTLSYLDKGKKNKRIENVTKLWEEILSDSPTEVERHLKWFYESFTGEQPKNLNLYDQYVKNIFELKGYSDDEKSDIELESRIVKLKEAMIDIRNLKNGIFRVDSTEKMSTWQEERLKSLMQFLGHTKAIPLLVALIALKDSKTFFTTVEVLERFMFRYRIVGNGHVGMMEVVYRRMCGDIRKDENTRKGANLYSVNRLRDNLKDLMFGTVGDDVFRAKLRDLKYDNKKPKRNEAIKVFFTLLEHYRDWREEGCKGIPICKEKYNIIDVKELTLEHIYPQKANEPLYNEELEKLKDCLGNLSSLSGSENSSVARKPFREKCKVYAESNIRSNRKIAEFKQWTSEEVQRRETELIDLAVDIFVP